MDPLTIMHQWWQELHISTLLNPVLFSLLLLFSFLYLLNHTRNGNGKPNLPPSPPKLPIIGNLHQLGTLLHRSFHALSEKYGPLVLLHLGNAPFLVVSSSEIAREIMKDTVFTNRPQIRAARVLFYGCQQESSSMDAVTLHFVPTVSIGSKQRKFVFLKS